MLRAMVVAAIAVMMMLSVMGAFRVRLVVQRPRQQFFHRFVGAAFAARKEFDASLR